jgi:spore coat protein CotF
MYAGYLLYKRVRELRIERRRCKEETELMKETYDFFKSQQGQNFKHKIQQLQGNARKVRNMQEKRTYKPRQRTDLTIEGLTGGDHASFEDMIKKFNETKVTSQKGKLRK